jgi:hypothetical protein
VRKQGPLSRASGEWRSPFLIALVASGAPLATPPPPPPQQGMNSLVNGAYNLRYQENQSTKRQTLGFGPSDSPVGLASWILEKWYNWSDHDGDIEKAFTKDELLTNIMICWVTDSGTSSSQISWRIAFFLLSTVCTQESGLRYRSIS